MRHPQYGIPVALVLIGFLQLLQNIPRQKIMWGVLEAYTASVGGVNLPAVVADPPTTPRQNSFFAGSERVLAEFTDFHFLPRYRLPLHRGPQSSPPAKG
jgi:hypothetical protein